MSQFYVPLAPGVEGRILKPHHPDPRFPMLGVELPENYAEQEWDLAKILAWTDRFGAVAIKVLGAKQRELLSVPPYFWNGVSPRCPRTRLPHTDESRLASNRFEASFLQRLKPSVKACTGVAGLVPTFEAFLENIPPTYPGDKRIEEAFKISLETGGIYSTAGTPYSLDIGMLSNVRESLGTDTAFVEAVQGSLNPEACLLSWEDYELVSISGSAAHWGDLATISRSDLRVCDLKMPRKACSWHLRG